MPQTDLGTLLQATATGPGAWAGPAPKGQKTITAHVQGTGAVTATVLIQVTNSNTLASSAVTALTFNLSGTTTAADAAVVSAETYGYYRANVTAISGTGATVTVVVGE